MERDVRADRRLEEAVGQAMNYGYTLSNPELVVEVVTCKPHWWYEFKDNAINVLYVMGIVLSFLCAILTIK